MERIDEGVVSVITPTYNHAPWIGACIESLQRQTYPHWEQIIVDDGSTDGTAAAIEPYLVDRRVRYIRQENRGIWRLAETYNRALRESTGTYVAVLEGDDFWLPDKLEVQLPSFAEETVGLAYGRVQIVDEGGRVLEEETARRDRWQPPFASFAAATPYPFLRDLLLLRGNVGAVSIVFRRGALEGVGGFWQPPYFPAVDYTTLLRVATDHRAAFVDRHLGAWRKHAGQTTDVHGLRYALGHTRAAVAHLQSLPERVRQALNLTEDEVWRVRRPYLADAYWAAARSRFRARDWHQASNHALAMLWWGNAFRRAEAAVALAAATVHVDPNPLIDRLGRGTMSERLAGGRT